MMISVVIPCHGGAGDTKACLTSLRAQDPSSLDGELELLVVDNASPDDTARVAAEIPGVRVLRQATNLGFAGGVNRGLRAARGDFVVVLNNDTLAAPNLIHRLIAPILHDTRIGMTAPVSNHVKGFAKVDTGDLGLAPDGRRELEAALADHDGGTLQDVDSLSGLCLAMPRAAVDRIGPFDERFGLGNYEDDDFCLRARLLGYRLVIVRDAFLHHLGNRTFHALGMDYRDTLNRNRALFVAKWQGDPAGMAALANSEGNPEAAARHATIALDRHPRWPDGHVILGRWHQRHGRSSEAMRHLLTYLAVCPNHTEAWITLAAERMQAEGEAAGRRCFAASMATCHYSLQATLDVLQTYGAFFLGIGRPEAATQKFEEALELAPDSSHFQHLLGKALLDAGRVDLAATWFAKGFDGGEKLALIGLSACQWQSGNWRDGLTTMAKAAAELPDNEAAQQNLEFALSALEDRGIETGELRRCANLLGEVACATGPGP